MRLVLAVLLTAACATAGEPLKLVASVGTAKVFGDGQLLVSPDGKTVVLGDRWYDFDSGKRIDPPFKLGYGAYWHSLLSDGTVVVAVSHESKLYFYPPKQTKPAAVLETDWQSGVLAANGKTAGRVVVVDKAWALQVALPEKGVWKTAIKDFSGPHVWRELKISADGSRIVAREHEKKSLTGYTVATDTSVTLDLSDEKHQSLRHPSISADGTRVSLHNGRSWRVYDAATLKLLRDIPAPDGFGEVWAGELTPDGNYLIGVGEGHKWIAVPLGEEKPDVRVRSFSGRDFAVYYAPRAVRSSGARQLLFTKDAGVVRLYDVATGKRLDTHSDVARGFEGQVVIDDRRALSWDADNRYVVWDTTTGKELGRAGVSVDSNDPDFGPNLWQVNAVTDTLAVSCQRGGCVHVRLSDGKPVGPDEPTGRRADQIRFLPDGRTLAVRTEGNGASRARAVFRDAGTGKLVAALKGSDDDSRYPTFLIHPNGRTAVTASYGVVSLHELATGAVRWTREVPRAWVRSAKLNPTGDRITVIPPFQVEVTQLDSRTGRITQSFAREERPFRPKRQPRDPSVVSPDGRWLLDAPDDEHPERLHLYDFDEDRPAERRVELTLPDCGSLAGIDFTPDGKRLVATYRTGVRRVWDISPYTSRPPRATAMEREAAKKWDALAGADAEAANDVMTALIRSPKLGLEVIAANLPGPSPDVKLVTRWIANLGDKDFRLRDEATKALTGIAHQIDAELTAALAAKPSPEATARLTKLLALARTDEPVPEVVRTLRALEVLEVIGTPEAKAFVEKLAGGSPNARLTRLAKESLTRFRK